MPCNVLVVEDDEDIRTNVSDALTFEGHTVSTAANGQVALQFLQGLKGEDLPHLILLDFMMPVMDGRGFINALAKEPSQSLKNIPIVILTAAQGSVLHSLPSKIEIVHKPVELKTLLQIVEKYAVGC